MAVVNKQTAFYIGSKYIYDSRKDCFSIISDLFQCDLCNWIAIIILLEAAAAGDITFGCI